MSNEPNRVSRPRRRRYLRRPCARLRNGSGVYPKVYVVCSQDQAIPPILQWRMVAELPCDKVMTLDTSHSPFISSPELLTAQLDQVANDAAFRAPLGVLID
jgi:hypothetical protein